MTGAPSWLVWIAVLAPVAALLLLGTARTPRTASAVAAIAPVPALALALLAEPGLQVHAPWLLFGLRLGVDDTARSFLLLTAMLWLLAGWFSVGYLAGDPRLRRYLGFFLAAQAGNFCVVLAQDIAGFYMGFSVLTFSAYGLVVHDGSRDALRAGRVYIAMAVVGEALVLVAFVTMAALADSTEIRTAALATADEPAAGVVALLVVAGFGVKVGLPLLHMWLPLAHPVAPTPASAVLSGAIIKAGVIGWLRFLPLGERAFDWAPGLVVAGVVAMFGAAVAGIAQRDPKTVLAYSSVSQMGYVSVAVGAGLAAPQAWPALLPVVAMYALHHGLAKGALFLGIGVARSGALPRRVWLAGLLLPAAALAGAPLTSGLLVKDALKDTLGMLELPWIGVLVASLPFASLATALMMARVVALAWRQHGTAGAHRGLVAPWAASLATVAAVGWLGPSVVAVEGPPAWKGVATLVGAWPIAAGAAIGWIAARFARGRGVDVPAGDVLVPIGRLLEPVLRVGGAVGRMFDAGPPLRLPALSLEAAAVAEARLGTWRAAGAALAALGLLFALAIGFG